VDGTPSGGSGPDTTTYRLIDGEPLQVLHDGEPVTVSTVGPALRPTRKKPAAL
jgi:alpha,alpha-trehalose phosphorylase